MSIAYEILVSVTQGGSGTYVVGRNGTFDLKAVNVWTTPYGDAYVEGIGKRGTPIRSGFRLPVESLVAVCQQTLERLGYQVVPARPTYFLSSQEAAELEPQVRDFIKTRLIHHPEWWTGLVNVQALGELAASEFEMYDEWCRTPEQFYAWARHEALKAHRVPIETRPFELP